MTLTTWPDVRERLQRQAAREAEARRWAMAACRLMLAAFAESPEAEGIRAANHDSVKHLDEHTRRRFFRNEAVAAAQKAVELETGLGGVRTA